MKLTEEEYTYLVQKRLVYKLTFDDYCKLKKDDRIITQLILLSFEIARLHHILDLMGR